MRVFGVEQRMEGGGMSGQRVPVESIRSLDVLEEGGGVGVVRQGARADRTTELTPMLEAHGLLRVSGR